MTGLALKNVGSSARFCLFYLRKIGGWKLRVSESRDAQLSVCVSQGRRVTVNETQFDRLPSCSSQCQGPRHLVSILRLNRQSTDLATNQSIPRGGSFRRSTMNNMRVLPSRVFSPKILRVSMTFRAYTPTITTPALPSCSISPKI